MWTEEPAGGPALRALVSALDGGPTAELVTMLAPHLRELTENGTLEDLGARLRPVRIAKVGRRFEHRLDALLETSDGLRLCMIGTESTPPHTVAFLDVRPVGGTPWQPSNGDRFVDLVRDELELVGVVTATVDGAATTFECVGGVDEHALFRIGSVSKPITAIGVHQCIADGLLTLDDPLDALLPDVDVPAAVTVGQVVAHTSGIESDASMEVAEHEAVPSIPELVAAAPLWLAFTPGTQLAYSNIGYGLLGHLIATARGEPLADVMRKHLFEPLAMVDTSYVLDDLERRRLADGCQSILGLVSPVPWTEVTMPGAGSVFSTAADLARLANAVLDDLAPMVGWRELGDRRSHSGAWDGFSASVVLDPARQRASLLLTNTDAITTIGLLEPHAVRLLDEMDRVD